MYGKEIKKVLITRDEIAKRVKELGEQINRDYKGEAITLVCTLRGASIFFADLVRELEGDVEMDFISVSSYGAGTSSSGEVKMIKDLSEPIKDKNVIVVEDIIDTGITLCYLKNCCSHVRRSRSKCALFLTSRQEEKSISKETISVLKSKTNSSSDTVSTTTKR